MKENQDRSELDVMASYLYVGHRYARCVCQSNFSNFSVVGKPEPIALA